MALYRENATGQLVDLPSPVAGYTAVSAMPTDTIANRVTWWRARDVDAALGQSSTWHPSLQSSAGPEIPLPPGLSGSGVNICAWRYSNFEETALPPLAVLNCAVAQTAGGYNSAAYLKLTATVAGGWCWLNGASNQYNIKLTPNKKWIVSLWAQGVAQTLKTFYVILKSSLGTSYALTFTTSSSANTWVRYSGVLDLGADASPNALMSLQLAALGAVIGVDALMIEERIGDGSEPSAYSAPKASIDGSQLEDGTCSVAKLAAGTIGAATINLNGAGSIIQSAGYNGSSGWQIRGDGYANFQNVTVRGSLNASDLSAGTINGARYGPDTIGAGPIIGGALHKQYYESGQSNSIATLVGSVPSIVLASATMFGPISLPANANRTGAAIFFSLFYEYNGAIPYDNDSGWLVAAPCTGYRSGQLLERPCYCNDGRDVLTGFALHSGGTGAFSYYLAVMKGGFSNTHLLYWDVCVLEFSK